MYKTFLYLVFTFLSLKLFLLLEGYITLLYLCNIIRLLHIYDFICV
jgi:hypothetical protein